MVRSLCPFKVVNHRKRALIDLRFRVWGMLEDSFAKSKDYQPTAREWLTSAWNGELITLDL